MMAVSQSVSGRAVFFRLRFAAGLHFSASWMNRKCAATGITGITVKLPQVATAAMPHCLTNIQAGNRLLTFQVFLARGLPMNLRLSVELTGTWASAILIVIRIRFGSRQTSAAVADNRCFTSPRVGFDAQGWDPGFYHRQSEAVAPDGRLLDFSGDKSPYISETVDVFRCIVHHIVQRELQQGDMKC